MGEARIRNANHEEKVARMDCRVTHESTVTFGAPGVSPRHNALVMGQEWIHPKLKHHIMIEQGKDPFQERYADPLIDQHVAKVRAAEERRQAQELAVKQAREKRERAELEQNPLFGLF